MGAPVSNAPRNGDWYQTGRAGQAQYNVWNGSTWTPARTKPTGRQITVNEAQNYKPTTDQQQTPVERLQFSFLASADNKPVSNILSYPEALNTTMTGSVDYVRFIFKEYQAPFGTRAQNAAQSAGAASRSQASYNSSSIDLVNSGLPSILMYMPEDIAARYGAEWGGKSIQNITVEALKAAGDTGTALRDVFTNWKTNLGNTADSVGAGLVSEGLAALAKVGQGEGLNINDVFGSTRGIVINPNTELLFVGFNLRSFDLNFKMVARTNSEAKIIRDIITTFKKAMLPSQSNDSLGAQNIEFEQKFLGQGGDRANFIQVPNIVEVMFMHNGKPHEFIPQYKPCAITEVGVNYTADGSYATYKDGEPVAITLSVRFAETKLVYKEEVRYGGVSF